MYHSAWPSGQQLQGVVRVRKLFAVMVGVALLTLSGFAAATVQQHSLGQIVVTGESGGGD